MKRTFRKRERGGESDDDDGPAPAPAPRAAAPPGLSFSSAPPAAASAPPPAASALGAIVSSGSAAPHAYGGGAFSYAQRDAPADRDGRAMLERKLALQAEGLAELSAGGPKLYRGAAGYTDFHVRDAVEAVAAAKWAGTLGPARAPSNVRGITLTDFRRDICKDYKETGQCPFGDSCIYIHDRSDDKSGWQLELEWQAKEKAKQARLAAHLAAGGTLEDAGPGGEEGEGAAGGAAAAAGVAAALSTSCGICRLPFVPPIVAAPCGHCFCEGCALERARAAGGDACAVCGKATAGILNAPPRALVLREAARIAAAGGTAGGGAAEGEEEAEAGAGGGWGDVS